MKIRIILDVEGHLQLHTAKPTEHCAIHRTFTNAIKLRHHKDRQRPTLQHPWEIMSDLSAQVGDRRITPQNAAVLMIDHQAGLCQLVRDFPVDIFKQNVLALADTAKLFKMKTILTTRYSVQGGRQRQHAPLHVSQDVQELLTRAAVSKRGLTVH